jgi:hypothetical protein
LNFWDARDPRPNPVDWRYSDHWGNTDEDLWAMSGNVREWTHPTRKVDDAGTPEDESDDLVAIEIDTQRFDAPTLGGSFRLGIGDCTIDLANARYEDKRARRDDVGFRLWQRPVPLLGR